MKINFKFSELKLNKSNISIIIINKKKKDIRVNISHKLVLIFLINRDDGSSKRE